MNKNEKKAIKVSLSTFFLIIAIIAIIVIITYICIEKSKSDKEISVLETNAKDMQSTIDNLQGKINSISSTINSNTTSNNNDSQINKTNNAENKFSNEEIKKSLQNYLDLVGAKEGTSLNLLVKLGLCNLNDYDKVKTSNDNYVKTNIKYSDYKEKMLNYVTEEWFNTKFKEGYKEKDGVLYYFNGGATGMEFEVKSITIKGAYSDFAYIAEVYNIHIDGSKELENKEFNITNNNGKCVINYCD